MSPVIRDPRGRASHFLESARCVAGMGNERVVSSRGTNVLIEREREREREKRK